jgi:hypothetical protein
MIVTMQPSNSATKQSMSTVQLGDSRRPGAVHYCQEERVHAVGQGVQSRRRGKRKFFQRSSWWPFPFSKKFKHDSAAMKTMISNPS